MEHKITAIVATPERRIVSIDLPVAPGVRSSHRAAMQPQKVVVATITLARNNAEERSLSTALRKLAACNLPIIAADGGSSAQFANELKQTGISVIKPRIKGLVPQVKTSLAAALEGFPDRFILYTEPDKYPFFEGPLLKFVQLAKASRSFGVTIAARDKRSFKTFPKGQQWAEMFMNQAAEFAFNNNTATEPPDYCYGPLLLSPAAAKLALDSPDDIGWGWRFFTMARTKQSSLTLRSIPLNLPCPKEQRGEDSRADRFYRIKQLRQNLAALEAV
ncbi:MAG TPA: hypothetical protein VF773_02835 [Verrucomicrobiae bacterium]